MLLSAIYVSFKVLYIFQTINLEMIIQCRRVSVLLTVAYICMKKYFIKNTVKKNWTNWNHFLLFYYFFLMEKLYTNLLQIN